MTTGSVINIWHYSGENTTEIQTNGPLDTGKATLYFPGSGELREFCLRLCFSEHE